MKYLLDTDSLIDCILDSGETRQRITSMIEAGDEVALCAITLAELYSGLSEKRRARWQDWLLALPYWQISTVVAMRAGADRKNMLDLGKTVSVTDSLIGALARENDAIVLTSNIKDYPMKDVQVLSLREKAV
jgi:predicted nucleic acid-binding protein